MSEFDNALAELRKLAKSQGVERIDVLVRQDGRVHIALMDRGMSQTIVNADLEEDGALQSPNLAMHATFAEWSGR